MDNQLDNHGMRPMTAEESAPILNHPKVIVTDSPIVEYDNMELPVHSRRYISIEHILESFDKPNVIKVFVYPKGLQWQKGYDGEPEKGPMWAHGGPPMYYVRTREIKK